MSSNTVTITPATQGGNAPSNEEKHGVVKSLKQDAWNVGDLDTRLFEKQFGLRRRLVEEADKGMIQVPLTKPHGRGAKDVPDDLADELTQHTLRRVLHNCDGVESDPKYLMAVATAKKDASHYRAMVRCGMTAGGFDAFDPFADIVRDHGVKSSSNGSYVLCEALYRGAAYIVRCMHPSLKKRANGVQPYMPDLAEILAEVGIAARVDVNDNGEETIVGEGKAETGTGNRKTIDCKERLANATAQIKKIKDRKPTEAEIEELIAALREAPYK